jgi:hypothetical protein
MIEPVYVLVLSKRTRQLIENALTEISTIAVSGVPDGSGYLFDASSVRQVLIQLIEQYRKEKRLQ